jgi:multidrug transporter EmrE-like cation transporter
MRSHALLFAVLALTVYGQLIIKARALIHRSPLTDNVNYGRYLYEMFTDVGVLSGLGAAFLAATFWILVIERLDVGYAYPFMALSFVMVPLGAAALFGEPLPVIQMFGLALVVAGVTLSALAR